MLQARLIIRVWDCFWAFRDLFGPWLRDWLTAAAGGMTDELARAEIEAKINSSEHPGCS